MKRVLLVKPAARLRTVLGLQAFQLLEPLELGYLAAAVPDGHDVLVADLRLLRRPRRALAHRLVHYRPDVVGFTAYSHDACEVKALARLVKGFCPGALVVVGGHHATVAPDDLDCDDIDVIVRGEGCGPFRTLLERSAAGRSLHGIENVLLTGAAYDREAASQWPSFPDPATLPAPRRDLWRSARYRSVWAAEGMAPWSRIFPPVSLVRASWGCRMKCSFCVVPYLCGGQHRPRPAGMVAEEIAAAPTDHIYFCDDENFIDEGFAFELADEIARRGIRKRYFAWTRATTVKRSPELFREWRRIGLDAAFLGFEFIDDAELRQHHKGTTIAANERALDALRSLGIAVHAAFMAQPHFDDAQFHRLGRYVADLPPCQCSFTICTPSPGTPDYEAIKDDIWVDNPYALHDCMHPLTKTTLPLRRFAELFAELATQGTRKTPLRQNHHPMVPADIWKVVRAQRAYSQGFKRMYRDYPRDLWS